MINKLGSRLHLRNQELSRSTSLQKVTLLIAFILTMSSICASCDAVSHDEVARSLSPDKNYECIVIERNGGATTSFVYWIYLSHARTSATSKNGQNQWSGSVDSVRIANLYGAGRNDKAFGVNLRWADSRTIIIECLQTKVIELLREVEVSGEKFKIVLKQGISDPTAPAGGMLYNFQRAKSDIQAPESPPAVAPAAHPKSKLPPKD